MLSVIFFRVYQNNQVGGGSRTRLNHFPEIVFSEDGNSQFPCFVELAPGRLASDDVIRFAGNATGSSATHPFDQILDFIAREALKCAGDDDGFVCQGALGIDLIVVGGLQEDTRLSELFEDLSSFFALAKVINAFCDDGSDLIDIGQFVLLGSEQSVGGSKTSGEDLRDALSDVADGDGIENA
jgi:hypothetical protein